MNVGFTKVCGRSAGAGSISQKPCGCSVGAGSMSAGAVRVRAAFHINLAGAVWARADICGRSAGVGRISHTAQTSGR
jgi:hypothetical protein